MMPSVVLHGTESSGKSTLAARLATHFGTVWVPEYGRDYCELHGTDSDAADLIAIMHGHITSRKALEPQARRFIIQDTDPLMTAAWSMMLLGERLPALDAFADTGQLYLLMDIDLPWVDDGLRLHAERAQQRHFFDLCRDELERRGVRWTLISGDYEQRFSSAVRAIADAGLASG